MTGRSVVVGINRTQDGSIAVAVGGAAVYSLQKERISRRKYHRGRLAVFADRERYRYVSDGGRAGGRGGSAPVVVAALRRWSWRLRRAMRRSRVPCRSLAVGDVFTLGSCSGETWRRLPVPLLCSAIRNAYPL